jgi:hypothetical protein
VILDTYWGCMLFDFFTTAGRLSSGVLCLIVRCIVTNVSEEHTTSIFMVGEVEKRDFSETW